MHFKALRYAALMVLGLLLSGCGDFLRGHKHNVTPIKIDADARGCLTSIPKTLSNYFEDQAEPASINQAFDCMQSSIKEFARFTKGDSADFYTDKEVQHYFNRYFLKNEQINDDFLADLMKIKILVAGGSPQILQRSEINSLVKFLDVIRAASLGMNGHIKTIFYKDDPNGVTTGELDGLQQKMRTTLLSVIQACNTSGADYQIVDLKSFITDLSTFLNQPSSISKLQKWMPFLESTKILFLGDNSNLMSKNKWKQSAEWTVSAYVDILKFYYKIRHINLRTNEDWDNLFPWIDDVLHLLETSPVFIEQGQLPTRNIDQFIEAFFDLNLIKTNFTPQLVKNTYRKFLVYLVAGIPKQQMDAAQLDGFETSHLAQLKKEYYGFKLIQDYIRTLFTNTHDVSFSQVLAQLDGFDYKKDIGQFKLLDLDKQDLNDYWVNWTFLLKLNHPSLFNSNNQMTMDFDLSKTRVSLWSMTQSNILNIYTRFVFKGYGSRTQRNLLNDHVTAANFSALEQDFRDFAETVGFLDSRSSPAAPRTLVEANLFTYDGDGDNQLSYTEIYEELNMMMTGSNTATQIYEDIVIQRAECLANTVDKFNRFYVDKECLKEQIQKNYPRYFAGMPGIVRFMQQTIAQQKFSEFFDSLLNVARIRGYNPEYVEYNELRVVTTLIEYVEALFMVYDKDKNGILDNGELGQAFLRFKPFVTQLPAFTKLVNQYGFIKKLGPGFTDQVAFRGFLYLLYIHKLPNGFDVQTLQKALPNIFPQDTNYWAYEAGDVALKAIETYQDVKQNWKQDLKQDFKDYHYFLYGGLPLYIFDLIKHHRESHTANLAPEQPATKAVTDTNLSDKDIKNVDSRGIERMDVFRVINLIKSM